jgi:hypothetical protein
MLARCNVMLIVACTLKTRGGKQGASTSHIRETLQLTGRASKAFCSSLVAFGDSATPTTSEG